jgi:hypothetical protein
MRGKGRGLPGKAARRRSGSSSRGQGANAPRSPRPIAASKRNWAFACHERSRSGWRDSPAVGMLAHRSIVNLAGRGVRPVDDYFRGMKLYVSGVTDGAPRLGMLLPPWLQLQRVGVSITASSSPQELHDSQGRHVSQRSQPRRPNSPMTPRPPNPPPPHDPQPDPPPHDPQPAELAVISAKAVKIRSLFMAHISDKIRSLISRRSGREQLYIKLVNVQIHNVDFLPRRCGKIETRACGKGGRLDEAGG